MESRRKHALLFQRLDDLNALGDALASAGREDDDEQLASLRELLDRHAAAVRWLPEPRIAAVLDYVDERRDFEEDLFGAAFVLTAVAPDHPHTTALLARLPQSVRDLLARATPARPRL